VSPAAGIRRLVARTPLGRPLRNWATRRRQKRDYAAWTRAGRPVPPPHLAKQRALVETGTFAGDMVEAMKHRFDRIVSIELSRDFHEQAVRRFRGDRNVELVHGDSGVALGPIVARLDRPALFWLDGHYSAGATAKGERETPILEELRQILEAPDLGHVIVVDDARLFGADPAYPTLADLQAFVLAKRPGLAVEVENDSIRIRRAPCPK
jgi:hypothetical protein